MGDITKVTGTATTPQTAHYLHDEVVAQRAAAGLQPINFNYARRIIFRAITGDVFILNEPKAGLVGRKITNATQEKDDSGSRMDNETLLGKYIYGSVNPFILEITQEY